MSGAKPFLGALFLNVTIFDVSNRVLAFIADSSSDSFDFVLGLDLIPLFKLSLNKNLKISQDFYNDVPVVSDFPLNSNINVNLAQNSNENPNIEIFKRKSEHLASENKSILKNFLLQSNDIFAKDSFDVGRVTKYHARVLLSEDRFIAKRPYRCSPEDQAEIERQVSELLKNGIIQESSSPFAAPVTMQYKKTGEGS